MVAIICHNATGTVLRTSEIGECLPRGVSAGSAWPRAGALESRSDPARSTTNKCDTL